MRRIAVAIGVGVAIGCLAWHLARDPSREAVPLLEGAIVTDEKGGAAGRSAAGGGIGACRGDAPGGVWSAAMCGRHPRGTSPLSRGGELPGPAQLRELRPASRASRAAPTSGHRRRERSTPASLASSHAVGAGRGGRLRPRTGATRRPGGGGRDGTGLRGPRRAHAPHGGSSGARPGGEDLVFRGPLETRTVDPGALRTHGRTPLAHDRHVDRMGRARGEGLASAPSFAPDGGRSRRGRGRAR